MTAALLPALDTFIEASREVARQRVLRPLELRLERGMMEAFRRQEERFLRAFRSQRSYWPQPIVREAVDPITEWEMFLSAAQVATLRAFITPLTQVQSQSLLSGARAAIADIGLSLSFSLKHPEAVRFMQGVPLRVDGINETTRQEIRRIILDGLDNGWSYDRVARELQSKWASFRKRAPQLHIRSRAHLIAVTEMGDAYTHGALIVGRDLKRAGLKMEKHWLTAGGERVCPICVGNAGEGWIPLDAVFSSGHDAPTGHPACRCDVQQRAVLP